LKDKCFDHCVIYCLMLWINVAFTLYVVYMNFEACVKLLLCMFKPFAFMFLIINDSSMNMYVMLFRFPHSNRYDSEF
jgi:hypothetical protein